MPAFPNIARTNLFYLIMMVVLLIIGSAMQALSPVWGLIATEWLLILPGSLIFLRLNRVPVIASLRLRWPGGHLAGLSLLIGVGLAIFALWLADLLIQLLGYSISIPGLIPTNLGQAVLIFIALAVSAPICEEIMFRGVIQRSYERMGPWRAVVYVGLLFAFYHLSFQRLFAIVPVALALGYVAWRSQSVVTSMLIHFAYNALAGMLTILYGLRPDLVSTFSVGAPVALAGLSVALISLWVFNHLAPEAAPVELEADQSSRISRSWSLAVAGLFFFVLAALEVVVGRYPEILATGRVRLNAAPWEAPVAWQYELRNILAEPVGAAACRLELRSDAYQMTCQVDQQAFEARQGSSFFKSGAYQAEQTYRWELRDLNLVAVDASQKSADWDQEVQIRPDPEGLLMVVRKDGEPSQELALPEDVLLADEWPFRLAALPFRSMYVMKTTLAWPLRWSETAQSSLPQAEEKLVQVVGEESLATPAGNFLVWKVEVGDQTAWYDTQAPYTLVQYDNGFVTYVLTAVQPEPAEAQN